MLAGCSSLPTSGPTTDAVITQAVPDTAANPSAAPYDVIVLNDAVVAALSRHKSFGLAGNFPYSIRRKVSTLGIGDVVSVSIYESSAGGLFGSGDLATGVGSKNVQLPPQQIDQSGRISVPFAGRIQAAGRTTAQVGNAIRSALQSKAIDPQALVTLTQNASNIVTVSGEVGQGGRFPLTLQGDRVLDSIASAGGPRGAAHDIYVRLTRGRSSGIVRFSQLVADPRENLPVQAGDQIFLYRKPDNFTILGASGRNATIDFDQSRLTLIEALGKAGGLNDNRADATGVFLFRYEEARIYEEIRQLPRVPDARAQKVPVVYQLDLRDPRSLLNGQNVVIRDKDVLYISNSPSTDLYKFLQLVGAGVGVVGGGAGLSTLAR